MLIVGSTAAKYWNLNRREKTSDLDVWVDSATKKLNLREKTNIDCGVFPPELIQLVPSENGYATPDALYTIKCSHLQWDVHWEKTKLDILWFKAKGCKLITELYYPLVEYWKTIHGDKSFLSLDKTKEDFFNDFVDYKVDHDYLHELVAAPNKPMYTYVLKEHGKVGIDKDRFNELTFNEQLAMFREEITVITIERFLLTERFNGSILQAYTLALKKTITNLTKNWASDFIIFNLEKLLNPDYNVIFNVLNKLGVNKMSYKNKQAILSLQEQLNITEITEEDIYELATSDFDCLEKPLNYEHIVEEGGEGEGEYRYGVFKIGSTLYKAEWSYYSYAGDDYSNIKESLYIVEPKKRTITVYE